MIDWHFIGELEGQSVLTGYVPDPETSASGVTIATGVDLGQLTPAELRNMALPLSLSTRLLPYVGVRGEAAVAMLDTAPLVISQAESDLLDEADRAPLLDALERYWRWAADTEFTSLPDCCQTVIASVAFQYGPNLRRRCPRFWHDVTTLDWPATIAELDNFGDDYPTRRRRESEYLAQHLALVASVS